MHRLMLIALCALTAYAVAQTNGFTASSSFAADEQTRFSLRYKLVSRADCGCASASNPEGNWDGCGGSGSGSGSGSASGMGSGSASGSGSGSGIGITLPSTDLPFTSTLPSIDLPSTPSLPSTEIPSEVSAASILPTGCTPFPTELPSTPEIPTVTPPSIGFGSGSGSGSGSMSGSGSGMMSASGSGSGECETSAEYAAHNGGWFEGDYCFLLQVFISWCDELSSSESITFRAFIDECQKTIIENGMYTDDERFVLISIKLQDFFQENISIMEAFQWKFIDFEGFSWGFTGFLKGCALDIVSNSSLTTISEEEVITVEGGSCPLTEAATEWAGSDSGKKAAVESFNSQVLEICESSVTTEVKYAEIHECFMEFKANYSSYASSFFAYSIEGFAPLGVFAESCSREWRVQNFPLAIGGDASSCPILEAIETIYDDTSYSTSFRSQVKQWYESIETEVNTTTSVEERISYFSNVTYQYFLLNNWNVSIIMNCEISGYGSIYEFIDACSAYQNGQISYVTGMPSTMAPTTEAATTIAPTTAPALGTCSNVDECNTFNTFIKNSTLLIDSLVKAQTTWQEAYVRQFSGYMKKLYTIASNDTITPDSCLSQSQEVLTGFATKSSTIYQMVHNITIETWGQTIDYYCNCA